MAARARDHVARGISHGFARPTAVRRFAEVARACRIEFEMVVWGESVASWAHEEARKDACGQSTRAIGRPEVWRLTESVHSEARSEPWFVNSSGGRLVPVIYPGHDHG